MSDLFIVWITKYALSKVGITKENARECGDGMICVKTPNGYDHYFHGEGNEWHRTKESAVAKAEEMRKKKVANLKKQLAKLEGMKFSV